MSSDIHVDARFGSRNLHSKEVIGVLVFIGVNVKADRCRGHAASEYGHCDTDLVNVVYTVDYYLVDDCGTMNLCS